MKTPHQLNPQPGGRPPAGLAFPPWHGLPAREITAKMAVPHWCGAFLLAVLLSFTADHPRSCLPQEDAGAGAPHVAQRPSAGPLGAGITPAPIARQRGLIRSPAGNLRRDLNWCGANPRYFTDGSGRAIYLTGSHTWNNLQDSGNPAPIARQRGLILSKAGNLRRDLNWCGGEPLTHFDYSAYLDLLAWHGLPAREITAKMAVPQWWAWEGGVNKNYCEPLAYRRTGPGAALDQKPKFNLNQFNQEYFDRLRARVTVPHQLPANAG